MTKNKPVIFLCFANDHVDYSRYLRNLSKETEGIRNALLLMAEKNMCEIVERNNATVEQIVDIFQSQQYRNRIAVFHYGGHANSYQILLENLEKSVVEASSEGLASFLSKQKGLKLVFLNACSTQQQAEQLTQMGVPVVVATSQAIDDDIASRLAIRFYKGIGQGESIEKSWTEAEDEIRILNGSDNLRALFRFKKKEALEIDRFPWAMYFKKGAEQVRNWNIPDAVENFLFGLPDISRNYPLPETPFVFLGRYEKRHANVFFGRSFYIRTLYQRISDPKSPSILLLYGQSGVGKSSLLEAGLFPRLQAEFQVVYARRSQDDGLQGTLEYALGLRINKEQWRSEQERISLKISQLEENISHLESTIQNLEGEAQQGIKNLIDDLKAKQLQLADSQHYDFSDSTAQAIEVWKEKEQKEGKPLVILLDQIDEVFTHANDFYKNELSDFLEEIFKIFADPEQAPKGKLILTYRKEFHPEIKTELQNKELAYIEIFLEHLKKQDIMEVIDAFQDIDELKIRYRIEVEKNLSTIIANDLLEDKESAVAPILQIVLTKIWRAVENSTVRKFRIDHYYKLKNQGIAMSEFFDQQIEELKKWNLEAVESGLVLDILYFHTTKWGMAISRKYEKICVLYSQHLQHLEVLINKLKELYLLTDVQNSKNLTSLAHDTLAPVIIKRCNESNLPAQRALRILNTKVAELKNQRTEVWIDEDDLKIVELGIKGLRNLNANEQKVILLSQEKRKKNKRKRSRTKYVVSGLATVAGSFFAIAIFQWQISKKNSMANELIALALQEESNDATVALRIAEKAWECAPENMGAIKVLGNNYSNHIFYKQTFSHKKRVSAAIFSPDGKYILTASEDKTAKLWDLEGNEIQMLYGHEDWVFAAAFSPDSKYILTGSYDHTARLWDLKGNLIHSFDAGKSPIFSVCFSPDGKNMLLTNGTAELWDLVEMTLLQTFKEPESSIFTACFSPDGTQILTGGTNAIVWNKKGEILKTFEGHKKEIQYVSFSPDGTQILTASADHSIKLWESNGKELATLKGHQESVHSAVFSPDGKNILTASKDHTAKLWDLNGNMLHTFKGHNKTVYSAQFSKNGNYVLTASEDRTAKLWDLLGSQIIDFQGHSASVSSVAFALDGKMVATCSADLLSVDKSVKIWNLTGQNILTISKHKQSVNAVAFSPDSKQILSGSYDQTARLCDLQGNEIQVFQGHSASVSSVAFALDGKHILTGSYDKTARLWNLQGREILQLRGHSSNVNSVAFSPKGDLLLTGGGDNTARLWDLEGNEIQVFANGHTEGINSVAFAPDGKHILTGSWDKTAKFWDLEGNLLGTFEGHSESINSVAFSPDGKYILTGSNDKTARVWDLKGNQLQAFRGHKASISSVAFSPNGKNILTGSADKTAKLSLTLSAFLKSDKAARLTLAQELEFNLDKKEVEEYAHLPKKELLRESAYYFENKAIHNPNKTESLQDLKKAVARYEKVLEMSAHQQDKQEAAEAYALLAEKQLYVAEYEESSKNNQKVRALTPAVFLGKDKADLDLCAQLVLAYLMNGQQNHAKEIFKLIDQTLQDDFLSRFDDLIEKLKQEQHGFTENSLVKGFWTYIFRSWLDVADVGELKKRANYFSQRIEEVNGRAYTSKLRYAEQKLEIYKKIAQRSENMNDFNELINSKIETAYYHLFFASFDKAKTLLESVQKETHLEFKFTVEQKMRIAHLYFFTKQDGKAKQMYSELASENRSKILNDLDDLERSKAKSLRLRELRGQINK